MPTVAFIPVRGGSKSIPLKNIKIIAGKPLVYWTVRAACMCDKIDRVYVATDSSKIMGTVESFKWEESYFEKIAVIGRSAESSTDTASSELAMLEFAEKYDFETIVLIQATSPLLTSDDLYRGFATYESKETDSVLSVVRQKRFIWDMDENGCVSPVNYDVARRPRRQEFDGYLVENGAFYITSRAALLRSGSRLSGRIRVVEMDEESYFEIDEPSDWAIIEGLLHKRMVQSAAPSGHAPWRQIQMLLTDCDGCLTDGGMYYSENGDELKKFHTRDGVGFSILKEKGILTGIITGEEVRLNERRAKKMGADIFVGGCSDKLSAVKELSRKYGVPLCHIAYIGDDRNDLEVIREVGFSCCPADAAEEVRKYVDYVASASGGQGVVREVADRL